MFSMNVRNIRSMFSMNVNTKFIVIYKYNQSTRGQNHGIMDDISPTWMKHWEE